MNHSRESYDRLARELGGYRHPWTRVLSGPDPELSFDLWLNNLLTPQTRVLEAGCGHGPDAARFGPEDRVSVLAHAPTWEDWQMRGEFMGKLARRADWDAEATARGMPYREERHLVLARQLGAGA